MLPGNIAYVALNSFGDNDRAAEKFEAAFTSIAQSNALILDVRNNGGGSSGIGWNILSFLTDKPFKVSGWRTRNYRPSFRAQERPQEAFGEASYERQANGSKLYAKPVVVLTSPWTASAAEDFCVAFDFMKRGKIIGEPIFGSTGQPLYFSLPSGGQARVCTKRDSYPDGREFVGKGVQPSVVVHPQVEDLRRERDTVLEVALDQIRKSIKE